MFPETINGGDGPECGWCQPKRGPGGIKGERKRTQSVTFSLSLSLSLSSSLPPSLFPYPLILEMVIAINSGARAM
jgi:hypothetical protein